MLGNAYRKQGQIRSAIKLYKHCLKVDRKAKMPAYNIAAAMARVDLYDSSAISAISEFESMKTFKLPDNEKGVQELMDIQLKIQALEEAVAALAAEEAAAQLLRQEPMKTLEKIGSGR